MGLLRERYAGSRRELQLYCCNQVWKNGGRIPWSAIAICETYKTYCLMRNTLRTAIRRTIQRTKIPCGLKFEDRPISAKDLSRLHQFCKNVLPEIFFGFVQCAGGSGKETLWSQTLRNWKSWTHLKSTRKDSMQRKWCSQRNGKFHFSSRRWTNKICWRRSGTNNIHHDTGSPNSRRRSKGFSWRMRRVSSTNSRLISGCR